MAYVALVNLANTICFIKKNSRLSELPYSFHNLDYPTDEIKLLEKLIRKLDGRRRNKRLKAFHEKIREAAHGLEDVIESLLSKLIRVAQSDQSFRNEGPSAYEEEVRQALISFVETTKKIEEEYNNEFEHPLPGEEDDNYDDDDEKNECSRTDCGGKKTKIVGSHSKMVITKIKDQLNTGYKKSELRVVSIVGVAGSGRSTFAWALFHTTYAPYLHKLRAFVCVGPKYEFKVILLNILSQIDDNNAHKLLDSEGEEKIFEYLYAVLKGGDYLIVLDDVREMRVWEYLKKLFPDENNGSRVLLTTHLEELAAQSFDFHRIPILHTEESWNLISGVLFPNQERCPPELEKAGKKIAKSCEGLRFEAAKCAEILSKVDKTPEHWNKVAAKMVNSVAKDAYDEMSELSKIMGDDYSILHRRELPEIMEKVLNLPMAIHYIWQNVYVLPTYVAVVGMAGIGKSAVAREVFDDPQILRSYDHRVWLTIGPKNQLKRILVDILVQLDPNDNKVHLQNDEILAKHISSILSNKKCFIVLDDVWDEVHLSFLSKLLLVIKCEVLMTTRLSKAAWDYLGEYSGRVHELQLLNEEESWSLLREEVFGEELCPRELERPGKLIAENCDGLPLMIVTVASLLSKTDEKTPEYWNKVVRNKNPVFELAYLKISKILYPSYKNLDLEHRACFLYMATFRIKCTIELFHLFTLNTVEGIIPSESYSFANFCEYVDYLQGKNLVLFQLRENYKGCRLHSVFWHFCVTEARNDKFFHVMETIADSLVEDIEKQRRLCVQNSVLFAIKDVYDLMTSVSAARSLLCFGPPHPYQVPLCLESKFLKALDAASIRFYEFPVGILRLVLLRYLALTYMGKVPAEISKLWNLEIIKICQLMSIRFPGDLSYLPIEIWEMKELKYLQVRGSNLPDPPPNSSVVLDRLSTLVDVRAESVTKSIFERIPNLKVLVIRIELAPDHSSEPLFSFDQISHLKQLETLSCVIENPELKSGVVVAAPAPLSMLPSSLKQLYLGGFGYPWEHMGLISLLPNLNLLQLQCYAFQGAEWVMQEGDFKSLRELTLEDTDLANWRADDSCHLLSLRNLYIRHAYKLKEIPWQSIPPSCKTILIDCNPSATKKMPQNDCKITCSWLDGRKV